MMLVLSVFTLLVLWHKNIIINGESFNKTQLNNTLFYHISLIMSKSFRQIGQLKQAGNTMNSTQTMPAHRRNKSIQTRNFSAVLERARQLYLSGQMIQAVDCINRGLYYDYNNLQLNFMLGVAHLTLNSYNQALLYLEKVAKISSKYKSNLFLLIAIAHKKKGDFSSALQAINTQIGLNQDTQALFYRARLYLNQTKYEKSLQDISKILLQNPHHAPALILKVKVYSTSKSYSQALEAIRIAKIMIEQIDKLQQVRLQQAYILTQTSKFQQAFDCICKIQKDFIILDSGVELAKARILQKSKREQQAIVLYNEILQKSIQSRIFCEAVSQLGIHYMKERDYYEAFSYLKRTQMVKVKSKPTDNLMKLAEGLTFLMKKKYAQAILLLGSCQFTFKHSLAQHTIFLTNLSLNGLAYGNFTLGNHQQALDLYRKMDRNDESTDSIAVLYNMSICDGILLHVKGYRAQAIQIFYKAFGYIRRPQPYFYIAVIQNQDFLKNGIDTEGLGKTLDLIQKGLRAGESAHMYYYRAVIYLFLGMNSEALEDIDRAIQKSQDNVARYFHARGVIFMLDKNYEQASSQFATALSIDENAEESAIQRAKCELLSGISANAYSCIQGLQKQDYWRTYFQLYQKDYEGILVSDCEDESILQTCQFMRGRFEEAGPAGKLIIAIKYDNHVQVVKLIQEAVSLGVSVGCLEINDLLILQAYSEYRLSRFQEAAITLTRVERALRQSNSHTQTYCQEDERKLLFCKVNQILINLKRDHRLQALQLTEQLLSEVCEGPTSDELHRLKKYLIQGGNYELGFGSEAQMINDYFLQENVNGMKFSFLIPMPHPKVHQVEDPQYENLLTEFQVKDIQNKPQAPWIKRGQYGVIFTNQIKQYENLNLKTQQNEVRSRQNGSQRISTRSRLKKALELSKSIMDKLDRLAKKNRDQED